MAEWLAVPNSDEVAHYGEAGGPALCSQAWKKAPIAPNAVPSPRGERLRCLGCVQMRQKQKTACLLGMRSEE